MGTNIIVNREKCNQTIMYIQRQYDQIMHMAQKNQIRGIDALCAAWQSENSEAAVKELVVNLNATFKTITKRYRRLINKLNNFAEAIFKSGGGHWKRIEFQASKEYQFSAKNAKNGQFKYNEIAVTEAIGRIRQLAKNIEKNQRETVAKFARNNEVFGKSNNPQVIQNFKKAMQSCSNEVKQDVDRCIKKFGITEEQQKVMIDKIEDQYGNQTLAKYSSEGYLKSALQQGNVSASLTGTLSGTINDEKK